MISPRSRAIPLSTQFAAGRRTWATLKNSRPPTSFSTTTTLLFPTVKSPASRTQASTTLRGAISSTKTPDMAQHGSQYYPSLVHQHNTLPQPPALSASGTFVLSSNPHDMLTNATTHDSPSPPSTSSSSNSRLNLPPVFSMPPVLPSGSQATTPDSYEARYRRDDRYDPPLMEKGIDADRIAVRHQIRYQFREAVEERDGARPYRVRTFLSSRVAVDNVAIRTPRFQDLVSITLMVKYTTVLERV
ncbi:hypothetical protein BDY19DRAFT_479104 [Irpex rosettiformis]|uniref:Uncharacterized protein n=1 Tax=Irpex rosettiformis TaxID=378272 RepID=A0ACB8TSL4_9APHY|nr:hypothetical protein BDY19DRAFT_479104 [Irpex rosettiformis]